MLRPSFANDSNCFLQVRPLTLKFHKRILQHECLKKRKRKQPQRSDESMT